VTLQRLVLTFKPEGIEIRTLYRSKDGSNPGTKARSREVTALARTGLQDALETLEEDAECIATSGFTTREDVLLTTISPDTKKMVKESR
jgi:hypothetical protein